MLGRREVDALDVKVGLAWDETGVSAIIATMLFHENFHHSFMIPFGPGALRGLLTGTVAAT